MKRFSGKTTLLAAILLISVILASFCGCSYTGEAILTLGNAKITENMFTFWLSRYKAQFEYSYGSSITSAFNVSSTDDFWKVAVRDDDSNVVTDANGETETYDSRFTEYIYQNAMTYLVSLYLFDEYGLKISDDDQADIDEYIDALIDDYADGSKNEFNVILAEYGFNLDTLRVCYETDAKISTLQDYLFATGGPAALTYQDYEDYYNKTYVRMDQICIFLDQCPEKSDDGKYLTDDDGQISYRDMTVTETEEARNRAAAALEKLNAGEDFNTVKAEYNENTESAAYTNGIYLSSDTVYSSGDDAATLYDTLLEMSAGEYKVVELEHTIHIIKKLELDSGAWGQTANADFFYFYDSSEGTYVTFQEYVKTPLFLEYIEEKQLELQDKIKINKTFSELTKISEVKSNPYF